MTWRESLADAEKMLGEAGVEDARTNAEYLAAHVLSLKSRSELRSMLGQRISITQAANFETLIARRASREPLQYILGEWEFFGLPIKVSPEALIPRPETELLVEEALSEAVCLPGSISVLDIGTGTGCIALAIASNMSRMSVLGIDVSRKAVTLANENLRSLKLSNATFRVSDIFSTRWTKQGTVKYDLIVSNPPYISQPEFEALEPELRNYEPRIALTDESTGLTFYKHIAEIASSRLTPRGRLLLEIGYGSSKIVGEILRDSGLDVLRIVNDLAGIPRVIVAEFQPSKASKTA
jgi:release factor glutamine methyltransferase